MLQLSFYEVLSTELPVLMGFAELEIGSLVDPASLRLVTEHLLVTEHSRPLRHSRKWAKIKSLSHSHSGKGAEDHLFLSLFHLSFIFFNTYILSLVIYNFASFICQMETLVITAPESVMVKLNGINSIKLVYKGMRYNFRIHFCQHDSRGTYCCNI